MHVYIHIYTMHGAKQYVKTQYKLWSAAIYKLYFSGNMNALIIFYALRHL